MLKLISSLQVPISIITCDDIGPFFDSPPHATVIEFTGQFPGHQTSGGAASVGSQRMWGLQPFQAADYFLLARFQAHLPFPERRYAVIHFPQPVKNPYQQRYQQCEIPLLSQRPPRLPAAVSSPYLPPIPLPSARW